MAHREDHHETPSIPKKGLGEDESAKQKDKDKWLKNMRGNLSMVATMIATMTFQIAINPPGGVVQVGSDDKSKFNECSPNNRTKNHQWPCPGEAVLGVRYQGYYFGFLLCNTVAFIASLSVCLLLVSGIPLEHESIMYLFSAGMCVTLTSLTLTYFFGALMVTPDVLWNNSPLDFTNVFTVVLLIWLGLLLLVALFLTVRFLLWCSTKSTTATDNVENI